MRALLAMALGAVLACWGWRPEGSGSFVDPTLLVALLYGTAIGGILGCPLGRSASDEAAEALSTPDCGDALWVVVPTLNELENLRTVLPGIRHALPLARIVVVDDASEDGTAGFVAELAAGDPRVRLIVREHERGLDTAWLAGFRAALAGGADFVVSMDADGSHDPRELPRLVGGLGRADIVVGSRYVTGGRIVGWPLARRVLSVAANCYARVVLGLAIRDCTSGYRAYRAAALRAAIADAPDGAGYALLEACLYRSCHAGLRVEEVPITYRERREGISKLRLREAWRGARLLWRLGAPARSVALRRPAPTRIR